MRLKSFYLDSDKKKNKKIKKNKKLALLTILILCYMCYIFCKNETASLVLCITNNQKKINI